MRVSLLRNGLNTSSIVYLLEVGGICRKNLIPLRILEPKVYQRHNIVLKGDAVVGPRIFHAYESL